jgi:hypothetical protein
MTGRHTGHRDQLADAQQFTGQMHLGVPRRSIIRALVAKTPLVLVDLPDRGIDWHLHDAIFARAGATPAAGHELAAHHGFLVELPQLYQDLGL